MKYTVFTQKLGTRLVERISIGILTALMILSGAKPYVAHAGFIETITEKIFPTQTEEEHSFPVSGDRDPLKTLTVYATAYSSDPWQTDDTPCLPAMWKYDLCENYKRYQEEDTIAANFLPLGTKVRFPDMYGDKVFTVRDRMNSRYNYHNIGYYRIDFYKAALDEHGEIDNDAARQKARDFGFKRGIAMEVIGV